MNSIGPHTNGVQLWRSNGQFKGECGWGRGGGGGPYIMTMTINMSSITSYYLILSLLHNIKTKQVKNDSKHVYYLK